MSESSGNFGSLPTLARGSGKCVSLSSEAIDDIKVNCNLESAINSASCAALGPVAGGGMLSSGGGTVAFDASDLPTEYQSLSPATNLLSVGGGSSRMKNSHSETAIKGQSVSSLSLNLMNSTNNISSVALGGHSSSGRIHGVSSSSNRTTLLKKDLVLSPLSRIAKGVQSLGLRAAEHLPAVHRRSNPNMLDPEAYEKLKTRKRASRTRIIEL